MKKLIWTLVPALMMACGGSEEKEPTAEERESAQYDLVIQEKLGDGFAALTADSKMVSGQYPDAKVKLGHFLYYDTQLSKTGKVSCNSCHDLAKGGVDNLPVSPGDAGKTGDRNSPTVLNAALHSFQFWDGRAKDVEEQAGMPILNPIEMEIPSKDFLMKRLAETDIYPAMFKEAFPGEDKPLTYDNLQKAIGAFERTLVTPSRFDQYLSGKKDALTLEEKKGLVAFYTVGCNTCHTSNLLGGNMFQKFGVHDDYWKHTGSQKIDKGVFALTKDATKEFVFKVPSLRNIAQTAPYFHDGSVSDLKQAVKIMAKVQLDRDLTEEETSRITAFLGSLTGEVPEIARKAPAGL